VRPRISSRGRLTAQAIGSTILHPRKEHSFAQPGDRDCISHRVGLLAAGCETARVEPPSSVPERLAVPANQRLARMFHVNGVQIYDCKQIMTIPRRIEWVFRAPEAELRDSRGHLIGRHYAGPTWEALDGSKIVGEVVARSDSPDPTAIPWLLLRAKSSSGRGIFGRTVECPAPQYERRASACGRLRPGANRQRGARSLLGRLLFLRPGADG
jgi:hypothetical protein